MKTYILVRRTPINFKNVRRRVLLVSAHNQLNLKEVKIQKKKKIINNRMQYKSIIIGIHYSYMTDQMPRDISYILLDQAEHFWAVVASPITISGVELLS